MVLLCFSCLYSSQKLAYTCIFYFIFLTGKVFAYYNTHVVLFFFYLAYDKITLYYFIESFILHFFGLVVYSTPWCVFLSMVSLASLPCWDIYVVPIMLQ